MADLGPPETSPAAGASHLAPGLPTATPLQPHPQSDSLGKRQRRPSVRLGEIGDQPAVLTYDASAGAIARRSKPWRPSKDSGKSSKIRPLTNLVHNLHNGDCHETLASETHSSDFNNSSKSGAKKAANTTASVRRARTNWSSKIEYLDEGEEEEDEERDGENEDDEAFDGGGTGSESPLKDPSPVHSIDNETLNFWNRRPVRASRVSGTEPIELENMPESDDNRKCEDSGAADGVREWLIGLGLGRYAAVFEIHEVDDEVLPLLTLDDLKDMGINAVGSRRKMYTAIQKLRKGFS